MKANKGDYVVLLADCIGANNWRPTMPINYVYELREDSHSHAFYVKKYARKDNYNNGDGWSAGPDYKSKLSFRPATTEEIATYQKNDFPCKALKSICYDIY